MLLCKMPLNIHHLGMSNDYIPLLFLADFWQEKKKRVFQLLPNVTYYYHYKLKTFFCHKIPCDELYRRHYSFFIVFFLMSWRNKENKMDIFFSFGEIQSPQMTPLRLSMTVCMDSDLKKSPDLGA